MEKCFLFFLKLVSLALPHKHVILHCATGGNSELKLNKCTRSLVKKIGSLNDLTTTSSISAVPMR